MSKPRHFGLHFPGCARRRGKECNAPGSKDPQLQAPCLCGPPPCGALHDTRVSSDPPIRSLRGQTTRVSCLPKPWPGRLLVSTAAHADQWPPAVRRSPCGTTACFCGGSSLWVMTLSVITQPGSCESRRRARCRVLQRGGGSSQPGGCMHRRCRPGFAAGFAACTVQAPARAAQGIAARGPSQEQRLSKRASLSSMTRCGGPAPSAGRPSGQTDWGMSLRRCLVQVNPAVARPLGRAPAPRPVPRRQAEEGPQAGASGHGRRGAGLERCSGRERSARRRLRRRRLFTPYSQALRRICTGCHAVAGAGATRRRADKGGWPRGQCGVSGG